MQSSPDIAALLERFDEPIRDRNSPAPAPTKGLPVHRPRDEARVPMAIPVAAPPSETQERSRLGVKGLASGLAIVLVPAALLFALWSQDILPLPGNEAAARSGIDGPSTSIAVAAPKQTAPKLEAALTSPDRIEADAGEVVAFPIVIDATAALPPRSIVAVADLPAGATFSEGRPYGETGWSLRPDEIGGLRLRLPATSDTADIRLELVTGDGTVLSRSQTQVSIAPSPIEVAATGAIDSVPAEESATEQTETAADLPPRPLEKPDVKVNTVKTVAIEPPRDAKPYDGGYGLGQPAEEPEASGEWMETKTAVDMHAKAEQSSETVKVVPQGGVKMRVVARDNRWIQVTDPKTSTTGWIYDRFLTPTDPPAQ